MNFHPELSAPPAYQDGTLRLIALGGLGEVGRNMHVLEYNGRLLLIDCGVLFPEENQPGVDLVLPDLTYLENRLDDIEGLVLTHGHEDHIGATPYLLRMRQDIPIIGSQLTLAFVESKLAEHRIKPLTLAVKEGQREKLRDFDLEFVAVNHSIPDALAVFVRTPGGTVLNTGDFKMDQLPLDGRITDLRAFARFGEEGVDIFQVDSTNADVPGFTTSEVEIGPTLDRLFATATGRIVVASFASHVHRVQQVINAAHAHGRKVAFVGRSMVKNMGIAADLGYLQVPDGILVDPKKADLMPASEVVYMSTGSQGEPMAALSRMANGDHKVQVGKGDLVILASSLIPGNENAVFRVINGLMRLGADVVHQGNARVHVSGHASAGELLYCFNILRPKNVMPIHGEVRHLLAAGRLAQKTGLAAQNVVLAENGVVIDFKDGKAEVVGVIDYHDMYVDGSSVGEITEAELKDRRILADEGFVTVLAVVDTNNASVVSGPEIHARGLAEDDSVFDAILDDIKNALEDAMRGGASDQHQLQQVMRRVAGRFVGTKLRRRPMIIPIVIEA